MGQGKLIAREFFGGTFPDGSTYILPYGAKNIRLPLNFFTNTFSIFLDSFLLLGPLFLDLGSWILDLPCALCLVPCALCLVHCTCTCTLPASRQACTLFLVP